MNEAGPAAALALADTLKSHELPIRATELNLFDTPVALLQRIVRVPSEA